MNLKKLLYQIILFFIKKKKRNTGSDSIKLNLKPSSPDERDLPYSVKEIIDIPSSIRLDNYCPKIKQQGSIGSCGSHAFCTAYEILCKILGLEWTPEMSELFHYYVVRSSDYENTLPQDGGQYLRNGAKVCKNVGMSPEKLCPYNTRKFNNKPSSFSYSFANFYKIKSYHRCWSVDGIKTALTENKPVVFGIRCGNTIFNTDNKGNIPDDIIINGGHAMVAIGYNDEYQNPDGTNGAIRLINSWGFSWGDNGYGWISYAILKKYFIEAWYINI